MTYLTDEQVAQLLRPINKLRVNVRDGMSHLEAYDVRAHLNRIFGFARWSADVTETALLFEDVHEVTRNEQKRTVVSVGYRATLRLTVCAPDGTTLATYTECATGDANNFPVSKRADAHDFAVKTAESQALKRCAINLGDQYGLGLYNGGSLAALVGRVLVGMPEQDEKPEAVDSNVPEIAPENATPEPVGEVSSRPVAPAEPEATQEGGEKAALLDELRERALRRPTQDIPKAYALLQAEAARHGLLKALTTDADGTVMTLKALIDAELKAAKAA